jgi:putative transposase
LKATCPTTTKGTAVVQQGSGVKVNHFYYWNNAFRNPEVIKTAVPVRYDPFDLSTAFAQVQGQWVTCRAPYLGLEDHTEKELLIATTELRRQARRDGSRADLSAERLATHMSKAVSHEALLRQRLRDLEQKKVLALIAGQSGQVQTVGSKPPSPIGPPEAVRTVSKLAALSMPVDVSRMTRRGDYP